MSPGSIKFRLWLKWKVLTFRAHTWLGRSSVLLTLYKLLGLNQELVVKPGSWLVIEGAARTATTYTYHGIMLCQPKPKSIAYHLHLPAQVLKALELDVPVLVTFRNPRDAVASAIVREPFMPVDAYLERYFQFYNTLLPHVDRFLVADFDEIVSDFPGLVDRLNDRFGLGLVRPTDMGSFSAKLEKRMEQHHRKFGGGVNQSYLPNASKSQAKKRVNFRPHRDLLARCEALYEQFKEHAER